MFKSETPFAPKNLPFYYGWVIVPATILGVLMSIPGQTAGFSAFTNPLITDLGISRSNLALSYFIGTVSSGFILPRAGRLLDQHGTRPVTVVVSICLGLVLIIFSHIESIIFQLESIMNFIPRHILVISILAGLILGLRFFAQGMLPMISNTMIGRWFDKKRGKVVAVMGMVNSIAFNSAPLFMSILVNNCGWQKTWQYLAILEAIIFMTFAWLFFRDNPESCGLNVDGRESSSEGIQENSEMAGITVDTAYKTPTFKILTVALCLWSMTFTAITFHLEAIGEELGLEKSTAMGIFVPVTFITIPVGFLSAWLSDRVAIKKIIMILCICQVSAYFCFTMVDTSVGFYLTIVFLGLTGGIFGPMMTIAYPWFFGRLHLGAINGKVTSVMVIFSALGPIIFSIFKEVFGNFKTALYFCAVLPVIVLILTRKISLKKLY